MDESPIARACDRLLAAYESGIPTTPITEDGPVSPEAAYGIQLHQVDAWLAAGRQIAGFKVGLTSRAIQLQLGVDRPDFGHLFSDMILDGTEAIDISRFLSPRLEPEISFVLKEELAGPGLTVVDIIGAIDYAIASVELIDSRIADWKITLADTIADNASAGGVVLGVKPLRIDAADLGLIGCVVQKNGEVVATGAGAAVLGHPLNAVLFLANTLGSLGRSLPPGSVVMAGALTAAVPIARGDRFTATFAQLGGLDVAFTSQAGVTP